MSVKNFFYFYLSIFQSRFEQRLKSFQVEVVLPLKLKVKIYNCLLIKIKETTQIKLASKTCNLRGNRFFQWFSVLYQKVCFPAIFWNMKKNHQNTISHTLNMIYPYRKMPKATVFLFTLRKFPLMFLNSSWLSKYK